MNDDIRMLEHLYDRFNARDMDAVLDALTADVTWANGMDGGHVHGRDAVRDYWTRQWSMVSPQVMPERFHRNADGGIVAEVRQTVRDLAGRLLEGQDHKLTNKRVQHIFRFRDGRIDRFDIRDVPDA